MHGPYTPNSNFGLQRVLVSTFLRGCFVEYKDHILTEAIRLVFVEYRRKCGLTQNRLSILTNLTRQFISQVEQGKKTPSVNSLSAIASAYNKSLSELFFEIDRFYPIIENNGPLFQIPPNIVAETSEKLNEYINNAKKHKDSSSSKAPPTQGNPRQ